MDFLHQLIQDCSRIMPDMPPGTWWLAPATLLLLGAAAAIDAFTARVPDPVIFLGLLLTTAVQGIAVDWPFAARHLALALAAMLIFWAVNQLWYLLKKRDALGMGDGKWTMLAVAGFGAGPAAVAWFAGAWLALGWIGVLWIIRRPIGRVHFAPFLFAGLLAGLYWLRLR